MDFRFNHARYRKRSPDNSRAGALAYEAVLRQKLARGESIEREQTEIPTFASFSENWLQMYVAANNKASEQRTKRYILNASLIPFFGRMRIDQIETRDVERYKAQSLKSGLTRKSVNNRLTVFNKCIGTAYEWLSLKGTPPRVLWLKCSSQRTDHLSPEECDRLLSAATGVVQDMILLALRTGMRQGEIRGLQWSSIDWQSRTLAVRHSRSDYTSALDTPKNHRMRHIPLSEDLHAMLLGRKQEKGYVFLDGREPFTGKRATSELAKVRAKAELRPIGWHVLRHTFASQLVMRGAPLAAVQALLGHSNVIMTMRYAHLAPSALRSAIDLLADKPVSGLFGQDAGNGAADAMHRLAA